MIYPVRLYGDPVLRKTASPVTRFDEALAKLAEDMVETMYHHNGIGLAAPQIGLSKRLFVAAQVEESDEDEVQQPAPQTADEKRRRWGVVREYVMVNPKIVLAEGVQRGADGCLSIPGIFVDDMIRAERVVVRYQDVRGGAHEVEARGRFAHILQHENDHLDGVFFFDRLPEGERAAFLARHRSELAQMQRDAKAFLKGGDAPVASIR